MKKLLIILAGMMMCIALAACGLGASAPQTDGGQTTVEPNTAAPVVIEPIAIAQPEETAKIYLAFSQALENLLTNSILPDGM